MNIEELCLSLRNMPFVPEDPLRPVDEIFGDFSLEKWLEQGFADAMGREMYRHICISQVEYNFTEVALKYFAVLNEIIPRFPRSYEVMLGNQFDFNQKSSRSENNLNLLDKLISKLILTIREGFEIHSDGMKSAGNTSIFVLLTKAMYYMGEDSMRAQCNYRRECINCPWPAFVSVFCDELSHTFMFCFIILTQKFPENEFKRIFSYLKGAILKARHIITKNLESTCPLVKELRNTYVKYNIDNLLETEVTTWNPLIETCEKFEKSDVTSALTLLSSVITHYFSKDIRLILSQQMCQIGIIIHLNKILTNPVQDERSISNIKIFLITVLELKIEDGIEKNDTKFNDIIMCVYRIIDLTARSLIILKLNGGRMHDYESLTASKEYEKIFTEDIYTLLHTLQCLHVLSKTWYQWFDIVDQTQVGDFVAHRTDHLLEAFRTDEVTFGTFKDMMQLCPAAVLEYVKREFIRKTLDFPQPGNAIIFKDISRNSVLSDVRSLFDKNLDDIKKRWIFTFDGESAVGSGTTKEVYMILSQELQKRELNLWQDEASHVDNLYVYSHNGLFPKLSKENLELFEFIGKLMAKAALEGIVLDIPLSDELFQQLRPMQYAHLRKDYYDIPISYPMTKQLIKQLISIKRQKDSIQSDSSLTNSRKCELIENLRFDDGNSFQDLFINFTVPGTEIELVEGGRDIIVSIFNFEDYMKELTLKQVIPVDQLQAIKYGFETIFPGSLNLFTPDQLKELTCGVPFSRWTEMYLTKNFKFSNGFKQDSNPVKFLIKVLASFNDKDQNMFLEFVTGFTTLTKSRFSRLKPRLTISKYESDDADNTLPYSSTCLNIIFLPEYSSLEVTQEKLTYAIVEGRRSFHNL